MALRRGEFKTALTGGRGVYGYWRLYGQDRLLILFNGTERMAEVAIALPPEGRGYWRPLYPVVGKGLGFLDQFRLALPPGSGMIWEQIK